MGGFLNVFLKPILKDVEALRELLRKHRVGEITKEEADQKASDVLTASSDVKRGPPVGNQNASKDKENNCRNPSIESQSVRAESNGVHRDTQRKLDRLAKDRPDLLERVCSGELKVNTAAKLAGIVKDKSQEGLQANVPRIVYLTPS